MGKAPGITVLVKRKLMMINYKKKADSEIQLIFE